LNIFNFVNKTCSLSPLKILRSTLNFTLSHTRDITTFRFQKKVFKAKNKYSQSTMSLSGFESEQQIEERKRKRQEEWDRVRNAGN
jgi:hypothetical protein